MAGSHESDAVDAPVSDVSLSEVPGLLAELHAVVDRLASADLSKCSDAELVAVATAQERAINRMLFEGNRQILEISDRDVPRSMGYRSLPNFMNAVLRVSHPGRRRQQMTATGEFRQLDGQPAEPKYPTLAEAFADGRVGPAHIDTTVEFLDALPHRVPHDKKVAAEATLAGLACEHTPAEIGELGQRLLDNLDPDGELTDDSDRKRRRNVWVNRQDAQQMSKLTGHLDPETRALIETLWAVWAKPGLNNPDDPDSPRGGVDDADPKALEAAAARDLRSPAQRKHDALAALLRAVFDDGLLGKSHRGLPVQLIIKADLNDLIRESGVGITATGSSLPMSDVIRLAAQAQQYLAVFADSSPIPLYFGQAKRLATRAQRLVSFARPDGHVCSAPDCDQPAAHVEMHHAVRDFADGGKTDIVDLAPACGPHNRMVGTNPGQFTTGVYTDGPDAGRVWWRRNSEPGAPPNPKRHNRRPDVAALFLRNLEQVRARIHPPPTPPPPQRRNTYELTEMIAPPISVVEACLALQLFNNAQ
ncbi:DUF222 domain-containing protein [Gordonia sp. HNM0687]|uniref:DUF222 domain-containing protein n=1 Tax=Gordonia mangrovi TaxID=2665643 RepID=A0A6L7GTB2_9ACTN|nr:DUF222 domain-containing protein [Gordonia mangrovi]UVF77108.1 HNH endonuclease [Gordonia mangrovi]